MANAWLSPREPWREQTCSAGATFSGIVCLPRKQAIGASHQKDVKRGEDARAAARAYARRTLPRAAYATPARARKAWLGGFGNHTARLPAGICRAQPSFRHPAAPRRAAGGGSMPAEAAMKNANIISPLRDDVR